MRSRAPQCTDALHILSQKGEDTSENYWQRCPWGQEQIGISAEMTEQLVRIPTGTGIVPQCAGESFQHCINTNFLCLTATQ